MCVCTSKYYVYCYLIILVQFIFDTSRAISHFSAWLSHAGLSVRVPRFHMHRDDITWLLKMWLIYSCATIISSARSFYHNYTNKWKEITLLLSSKLFNLFDYSDCVSVVCCRELMAINVILRGGSNFSIGFTVLMIIIRYDDNMYPVYLMQVYSPTHS
jgi:hypothetical protein